MLVVELVERAIVDVLIVDPEEVLPHVRVKEDLGASAADVEAVLQHLQKMLSLHDLASLCHVRVGGPAGDFTVEELVDLVESRVRQGRGRRATSPTMALSRRADSGSAA